MVLRESLFFFAGRRHDSRPDEGTLDLEPRAGKPARGIMRFQVFSGVGGTLILEFPQGLPEG